jgi:spermidine/putrescine transport system permease protein
VATDRQLRGLPRAPRLTLRGGGSSTAETRGRWLAIAQLSPAVLFLCLFLVAPVCVFLVYSFWRTETFTIVSSWNLDNYSEALTQDVYRRLLQTTVEIALVAAFLTVVVAYAFAHVIRFHLQRWQERLLFLVIVALFSGYLVRIYAWRTLLGDHGVVNDVITGIGIVDEPLSFLLYSRTAVTIVFMNFLIPLAILPIYAALQGVRDEEEEAARDLGCGPLAAFRRVTLPLAWNGIFTAFALSFIIAAGDYVTPQLVGGSSGTMIGRTIADTFGVAFDWPRGAALSFLTLLVVLVALGTTYAISRRIVR